MKKEAPRETLHSHGIIEQRETECCIVGSGPAGAVLALLLARRGVSVTLLEEHLDFDRDFRGDTIHPSTMQIMDEIGLAQRVLQLSHTKVYTIQVQTPHGWQVLADFRRLHTRYPYIALIPQVRFLELLTEEAQRYPNFQLVMGARAEKLVVEDGYIHGVQYRGQDGWHEVRAPLTVGADGRFSRIRRLAGFEPVQTTQSMDVLWFHLPRRPDDSDQTGGHLNHHRILVILNRSDYWQVGYVIPKGGYQQLRAQGLEALRHEVAQIVPEMADRVDTLQEWKQVSVLSVESSRLRRWYRPGLLLIGDAAHVMSPIGGVGINYAIQDAVITSNVLGEELKEGKVRVSNLAKIQRQREIPIRVIQGFQNLLQQQVLSRVIRSSSDQPTKISPLLRFLRRMPLTGNIEARLIGFGVKQVHVKNLDDKTSKRLPGLCNS